jgi:phage shock protein PspC (stress-responsive transcriptional regulator)
LQGYAPECRSITDGNVTTIRLLWLLLFLFAGTGGLLYLILWIVTPNEA